MELKIYDPAMCCNTGVCGSTVDPSLAVFAADVEWLKKNNVEVKRYNLAHDPEAFTENPCICDLIQDSTEVLPVLMLGDTVVCSGFYPNREQLAALLQLDIKDAKEHASLMNPQVAELVAIGAAIASNCEPCLAYHVQTAEELGVSTEDMIRAINLAHKVKQTPARHIMEQAERILVGAPEGAASCCGGAPADGGSCC